MSRGIEWDILQKDYGPNLHIIEIEDTLVDFIPTQAVIKRKVFEWDGILHAFNYSLNFDGKIINVGKIFKVGYIEKFIQEYYRTDSKGAEVI
jgi:hypothetical protein